MDPDSRAIILILLLVLGAIYCAATETALASVSRNRIKIKADKNNARAKKVLAVLDNFDDAITTLLICTNICHIVSASVVTALVTKKWGLSAVTASTFIMTFAMFFVAEMLPKSIGKKLNEPICLAAAGSLSVLMKLLKPASKFLSALGALTLKLLPGGEEVSVTEDEIYDIIEDMKEEGSIDEEKSELISSALSFGDLTASSVLTPRVDIEGIEVHMPQKEVLQYVMDHNRSRLVVYDGTVDNIVGVLRTRNFLKQYLRQKAIPNVRKMMDEVFYAHQSMPIDELLNNMSQKKFSMAVVLDGFGGTLGLVTMEDMLEEIVGEIWDEDDEIKEPIVKLTDDVYLASADETVGSVFDFIKFDEPDEDEAERFKNLLMADWVYEMIGDIPKVGDSFKCHNLEINVEEIEHNRIRKLKIKVNEIKEMKEGVKEKHADKECEPSLGFEDKPDKKTEKEAEKS